MLSPEYLSRVVQMYMESMPYLLFRSKAEKDYVILIFCPTSIDDTECEIQKRAEVIKQEVAVNGYQLRFKVETIPFP